MGLTLADGNFGYSRDPVPVQGQQGDAALAKLLQDPTAFLGKYGSQMAGFKNWFDANTKTMSAQDKAKTWNDVVGDYSTGYRSTAGQEFIPGTDSINQFVSALSNLNPGRDFNVNTDWEKNGVIQKRNSAVGDAIFDPTTGTYTRTANYTNPAYTARFQNNQFSGGTPTYTSYSVGAEPGSVQDSFTNLFDYVMRGKDALSGNASTGQGDFSLDFDTAQTGNATGLGSIFSGLSTDRLTRSLTDAYKNITGSNVLPADVLSGIRPGSYDYYKNPGQYDTDYNSMLSNLFNSSSAKSAIDPMYTQAQTKLGFTNNDANRTAFNTSAAKYGLSNVMNDISGYVPIVTNPVVLPPVVNNPTVPNATTPTPTNPTGSTPLGGTAAGTQNYLSTMYPGVSSRTDMNRGSRYFDTNTGQYNQNLSNMYGSNNQSLQQGL